MNIIFFGTPYFSAYSLTEIIKSNYKVISVVTKPDTKKGRGRKILPSEVKKTAIANNIEILEPSNLNDINFLAKLQGFKADLFVIIAFEKLPETVWKIAKKGAINLHTSLLPEYRGSAPINRVIINGEKDTGITTFYINDKIDTGDIIMQKKISLTDKITAAQLHNKMMIEGCQLILDTISKVKEGNIKTINQNITKKYRYANKISKDLCRINWKNPIINIYNLIRGLSPFLEKEKYLKDVSICPSAWCFLNNGKINKRLKINNVEITEKTSNNFLSISTDNRSYLHVNLKDNSLAITHLQLEGKKRMNIKEFLRGTKISVNHSIS